jgi:hypothetical protein
MEIFGVPYDPGWPDGLLALWPLIPFLIGAVDTKITDLVANAQANIIGDALDTGYIRIYSGTIPVSADAALSGNTLLAELRFAAAAFPAAAAGVITAGAITGDAAADATGTATFFRTFDSGGAVVKWQGTVGTATSDMIINSTAIQAGAAVNCSALTYTVDKG